MTRRRGLGIECGFDSIYLTELSNHYERRLPTKLLRSSVNNHTLRRHIPKLKHYSIVIDMRSTLPVTMVTNITNHKLKSYG